MERGEEELAKAGRREGKGRQGGWTVKEGWGMGRWEQGGGDGRGQWEGTCGGGNGKGKIGTEQREGRDGGRGEKGVGREEGEFYRWI